MCVCVCGVVKVMWVLVNEKDALPPLLLPSDTTGKQQVEAAVFRWVRGVALWCGINAGWDMGLVDLGM